MSGLSSFLPSAEDGFLPYYLLVVRHTLFALPRPSLTRSYSLLTSNPPRYP